MIVTGLLGTVAAGGAIAFTVDEPRRWAAFLTAVGLGVVLVPLVLVFDSDAVAIAISGLVMVIVTSVLVRTGTIDAVTN